MKKLSPRLQAAFDFVPQGAYFADIGADHAYLTLALLEKGKIEWAQAVENKTGPFIRMKTNVDASPYASHVLCTQADGLDQLSEDVDCIALCGMGGKLAADILERGKSKLEKVSALILDPHRDLSYCRKKAVELGYYVEDEKMVFEDKIYYSIIHFQKGAPKRPYTNLELALGPVLLQKRDPVFLSFIADQQKKVGKILDKGLSETSRRKYLNLYRALKSIRGEEGSEER